MSTLPDRFAEFTNRFLDTIVVDLIRERAVPRLSEPMIYSLAAGGKRLRPVLCLLAAGADVPASPPADLTFFLSEKHHLRRALYLGAALECIHTYSLIHDDLPAMDDDDLRRGRPSCHKQFGDWAAILAGDALNTLAFELVARAFEGADDQAGLLGPAISVLAEGAGLAGMVAGQALDLDFEKNPVSRTDLTEDARRDLLREIHAKKTTALIRASLELGAVLSRASRDAFRAYGQSLGMLFQISDDLLDRTGTSEALGKTPGKDEAAGKLTYPALYGMDESRRIAGELADRARAEAAGLEQGPRAEENFHEIFVALPAQILNRSK